MVTILLVDDDINILDVTAAILEYCGYAVACTNNGQEALDYLENNDLPDLVLSDMMMPIMDGRELCLKIQTHAEYSSIPFIMMSGALGAPHKEVCNYSAFVAKPFEALELIHTVERLLKDKLAG